MTRLAQRCLLLGGAVVIGVGGFSTGGGQAWAQQRPPAEPPLSITVEGGFTSRDVEETGNVGGTPQAFSGTADSGRLLVTFAYKPIPQLTLYAVGGGADLQINDFDGYSGNMNGIYGGGLTLSANVLPGGSLFIDGRYLRSVTDDTVVMFCGPNVLCPSGTKEKITWNEYRARLGVKSRFFYFAPYGGIQVSFVRADDHVNQFQNTGTPATLQIEEQDTVGLFGGFTVPLDPQGRIKFFTEFNLIDEYAIRGGLTFGL